MHVSACVESMVCGRLFSGLGGVAYSAAAAPRTALDPDSTGVVKTEAQHLGTRSCASKEETSLDRLCLIRVLLLAPGFLDLKEMFVC